MQFHRGTENLLLHLSLVYLSQFLCISYFYRFSIEHLGMGINLLMTDKSGRAKKKTYCTCTTPTTPSPPPLSFIKNHFLWGFIPAKGKMKGQLHVERRESYIECRYTKRPMSCLCWSKKFITNVVILFDVSKRGVKLI